MVTGKGQGSRLITTVMETSSSATRRVPSCTPLNMGLEFPGFLLRQGRFEAVLHCVPSAVLGPETGQTWRSSGLRGQTCRRKMTVLQGALASRGPFWKELAQSPPCEALDRKE
ncbi:hypothetical protein CB1_000450005 [Camelus ferus]|nr:hypothetical protein CB1_000450005 [Camelus ferus]